MGSTGTHRKDGVCSVKEYPFEVYAMCEFEGCRTVSYMTKGHHDKKKFIDEIKEQYKADVDISKVQHSWGKVIPFCGDSQCVLHTFNKPVRGSFPMTYVNV